MKRTLALVVGILLPAVSPADPIDSWNQQALSTVKTKRASDADAARLYAMVNVAMYDAVNGLISRGPFGREQALVPNNQGLPFFGDLEAAAAAAAHAVLVAAFPDLRAGYDAQLAAELAALSNHFGVEAGRAWGARVGAAVVAARQNDGSSPVESQPGGTGPGAFRAAWSGVQYRNLVPFAIDNPADFVTNGPPPLDSVEYAAAYAEVNILGNAALPDAALLDTYNYWSLGTGSVQPPGDWADIALEVSAARGTSLWGRARLLALLTMAMIDTVPPAFTTKFTYHSWRPTTAIREGDVDGNGATPGDAAWSARAGTVGGTPEHISGHSSFSTAAATVLAGFYCRDNIGFTHVSDTAPGGAARTYDSFSAAATEAGRSRIMGGVHFEFSNRGGADIGRGVATEVLAKKLLFKLGPTHLGSCPL